MPEIEKLVPVGEVEQPRPDAIKAEFGASGEEIRADAWGGRFDRFSDGFVFHALAKCSALPRKLFPPHNTPNAGLTTQISPNR